MNALRLERGEYVESCCEWDGMGWDGMEVWSDSERLYRH